MKELRAIIFDCDGTLADTMPIHYEAWRDALTRFDLDLSEDRFYELGGWPTKAIIQLLARETGRPLNVEEIADFKEKAFEERLDEVEPIAPVVAVVREFQGKLPLAVATGARARSSIASWRISGWPALPGRSLLRRSAPPQTASRRLSRGGPPDCRRPRILPSL